MPDATATLLHRAADHAIRYLETLDRGCVAVDPATRSRLTDLIEPLPSDPSDPTTVLDLLDTLGSPATTATAGGRFFGFVIGGTVPASLAASWLASTWDQDAGMSTICPINATLEEVSRRWLLDLFNLPPESGMGFVTGGTMANFSCLAAARYALLAKTGWDVEARGLFGAPPITVIVSEERHVSIGKALSLLGLGRERVVRVPTDTQGRMRSDALPEINGPAIVCIQAGNVNTGAVDPAREICAWAHQHDAWVHVDGAFGLWAAVSPDRAHLVDGVAEADSWATDAHKWLNAPYDNGLAIVRNPEALRAAMAASAAYLVATDEREPDQYTPEMSRRARGVEVWAALRSLGRTGLADLIERCCRYASRFAQGLSAAGYQILNDVTLNQVLVSFGTPEHTCRVIDAIQADGTCWCGGTTWQGHTAMRISVSSWATADEDVEKSLAAMLRIAHDVATA